MRAMVPDGRGSVLMDQVNEPTPLSDEVVVEVEAYSVNRGESFLLENPPQGWRPGKDIAGRVVAAGSDARSLIGQRVVGHPEHSGWAERVTVPISKTAVLPLQVPSDLAAALPLAGLTALRLVRTLGDRLPGARILMTGASGGVGHYFIELAAALGGEVTAVCSSPERGEKLLDRGAARIVVDLGAPDEPYDVVIESVGGRVTAEAWRMLKPRGLFVWMGQASRQPPTLDFFDWTGGRSARLQKFLYSESDVPDAEDLRTLVRLTATGRLNPGIGRLAPWVETPAVLSDLVHRLIRGNAIMKVAP